MKGRGTRVLTPTDLQAVSGEDAHVKTHFIIVDAVGVCESDKTDSRPLERQRTVPMDKLLLGVAMGKRDEDTLTTLAGRLARLDRELTPAKREELTTIAGGKTLSGMSSALLRALDPDVIAEKATGQPGANPDEVPPEVFEAAQKELVNEACAPFDKPALREALVKVKKQLEQTIDTVTIDLVLDQGFDAAAKEKAASLVTSFREFIVKYQAEITALQILYNRPYKQHLTEAMLKELEKKLQETNLAWNEKSLWTAFAATHPGKVKGRSALNRFADLVPLVRFALQYQPVLEPFAESVQERFEAWLMQKAEAGINFTPDQRTWLELIRDHIATSLSIEPGDFDLAPFSQCGGLGKVYELFGKGLPELLEELNEVLAA